MIFSVITPSFNCKDFILRNISSVRQQQFGGDKLEHWVIDGGSTDGTLEILRGEAGIHWISEPDKGLSDAVNKGILRSKGDWIIWLNADDFLAPNACTTFLQHVKEFPRARIFCGDVTILRYDGSVEQTIPSWDYNLGELLESRTGMNQPSTWVHREVYEKAGLLDVENRYAMDYEWLVRAMHQYQCVPIPAVLSFSQRRKGSITDANLVKQFEEFLRIRRKYGRPYLSKAEMQIRFYIYTEWLRRIPWVRRNARRVKRLFGREPLHPL
jgi:glycosyltransferase involved in cell wall biosynthesis